MIQCIIYPRSMTDSPLPDPMRDHWERTAERYEAEGDAFTSPWGIALQTVMLAGLVALTRIDWATRLGTGKPEGDEGGQVR